MFYTKAVVPPEEVTSPSLHGVDILRGLLQQVVSSRPVHGAELLASTAYVVSTTPLDRCQHVFYTKAVVSP